MTSPVHHLKPAESPAKSEMLRLIDELRAGIEDGSIISLVAIPVHPGGEWTTRSEGQNSMLEIAGLLGRAWLDANGVLG